MDHGEPPTEPAAKRSSAEVTDTVRRSPLGRSIAGFLPAQLGYATGTEGADRGALIGDCTTGDEKGCPMDEKKTGDETREREAKDTTTDWDTGSGGGYGPPNVGERGDPQRDPESKADREPVKSEPGDIPPTEDPTLGKETHGS